MADVAQMTHQAVPLFFPSFSEPGKARMRMIWNSLAIVAICLEISVSPLFLYRLNHVEQKVADAVFFLEIFVVSLFLNSFHHKTCIAMYHCSSCSNYSHPQVDRTYHFSKGKVLKDT